MLSFLYPAFLIGAAAAAIPVLLHLLRNAQAPELRFSAVRLLRGVRVEHAQRRRVRDWLLLALRVAALVLLALAFARPYTGGGGQAAGPATVIVLDRSASMGAPAVWSAAQEAALAAVNDADPRAGLAVVAFDDRPEVVAGSGAGREQAGAAIRQARPGVGASGYAAALARASALLEDAAGGTGRIVLVSDLQGSPADARSTLPESVSLEVIPASRPLDNLAVLGIRPDNSGVLATVRNDGADRRRVRLEAVVDGARFAEALVEVPAGETAEILLAGRAPGPRMQVGLVEPDPPGLTFDDVRFADVEERPLPRIVIVGTPEGSFYLRSALLAGDAGPEFAIETVAGSRAAAVLSGAQRPHAVFVTEPRGLDRRARESLLRFARSGGGILLAAADNLHEAGFGALVEGLELRPPRGDDPLLTLAGFDGRHPIFRRLGHATDGLAGARFTRAWRARAAGWQMLARFDGGAGALFEKAEGNGRVVFFASDLNRGWNDLPLQSAFVPFVQEVARYLAPEPGARHFTPGSAPAGTHGGLGFVATSSGGTVVVNADIRESDPARMDPTSFKAAVKRRPARRDPEADERRRAAASESGQALWRYGLLLMFGTLVAEGLAGARRKT